MLIGFILNIVFNLTLRVLYQLENKKRDKALEGKSQEEIEALKDESRVQGFDNVTDKHNVSSLRGALLELFADPNSGLLQILNLSKKGDHLQTTER
jgi:hypothetical protein